MAIAIPSNILAVIAVLVLTSWWVASALAADAPPVPNPAAKPFAAADPLGKERQRAKAALEEAIPRAAKDPTRPVFHFRPPARWMNDICGAIWYNGYHHVFYQNNPFSDDQYGWGWGHARSKDLVEWEELPFALVPMKHRGELRCNSGCVTLDGNGRPMIFYTFVPQRGGVPRCQWAAMPLDEGLLEWRRVGDKPLMAIGENGVSSDNVDYADGTLDVAGTPVALKLTDGQATLKLHVFLDRPVMEVFVNDGQTAVTRVEYPAEADLAVGVFAENARPPSSRWTCGG